MERNENAEDSPVRELWVEKYRPARLDEMVLSDATRDMIGSQLDRGTVNHCLFVGKPGIGKTTLARVIASELGAPLMYVNAGYEGGIDTIRTKVKAFCDAATIDGRLKVVVIDEADALSSGAGAGGNSSAQSSLRNLIEEASDDTRFLLTANYANRIIDPLKSRCTQIGISFTIEDAVKRIAHILRAEGVSHDQASLKRFVSKVVKRNFPDIRSMVKELENWCSDGTLKERDGDINTSIEDVIRRILEKDDYLEIRRYLIENEHLFNRDYVVLAQELFNRIPERDARLTIADALFRMHMVTDQEIQFTAMMIAIKDGK